MSQQGRATAPPARQARQPAVSRREAPSASIAEAETVQNGCTCGGICPRCGGTARVVGALRPPSPSQEKDLPASVLRVMGTPGRPLDAATRSRFARALSASGFAIANGVGRTHASAPPSQRAAIASPQQAEEVEASEISKEILHASAPMDPPPDEGALRGVRIHTDTLAAESARALSARAYAFDNHIVFAAGRFVPGTLAGDRLIAHELVHVLQAARGRGGLLILRQDEEGAGEEPTPAVGITMTVSLDGLVFDFGEMTYHQGLTRMPLMALILRRLLGPAYQDGLEARVLATWEPLMLEAHLQFMDDLEADSSAKEGERIGQKGLPVPGALLFVDVLEQQLGLPVLLSDQQRELLRLGVAAKSAWAEVEPFFPGWYDESLFRREMAQHADLLRQWSEVETSEDTDARDAITWAIVGALSRPIDVVDAIRRDFELANESFNETDDPLESRNRSDCSVGYRVLWQIDDPGARVTEAPPEEGPVLPGAALTLLTFLRTQPDLLARARMPDDHAARKEVLARFTRFMTRVGSVAGGDEQLLDQPARANADPWAATLSSSPPLDPPLFDVALETDIAFTMLLQWGHWTDAFAEYIYKFDFIKVPEPRETESGEVIQPEPLDLTMAAGQRPDIGTVFDTRLARAYRYNETDIERIKQQTGGLPFGESALDLVEFNNALRVTGTIIRTVLDTATQPSYTARIVFPEAGLYVVRCRAIPFLEGDEEVVRLPSIALLPVIARAPDEMAVRRVQESAAAEFRVQLRIAEIQAMLAAPLAQEDEESLQRELADLRLMVAGPTEALEARRNQLDTQIALLERRISLRDEIERLELAEHPDTARIAELRRSLALLGGQGGSNFLEERELQGLRDQKRSVEQIIDKQGKSTAGETGTSFAPHVTFVSDLGPSLELSLVMYDRGDVEGEYQVFISDLTTPDSGQMLGTANVATEANPRLTAILNGLRDLLESSSDYGRGRAAIQIDTLIYTVPVQAGTGRMLSEAIESGTMVLSLAAVLAAPLTEGASLYLLLPLGAIGAVPSGYRLIQRYEENRFRILELATLMDIANVLGGAFGLAQAATPLRMVRLGAFLMVMGIGADGAGILLMGAGIVAQLDALRGLPEHERAARMLEILGNAMLSFGIQAGGMIAHARYQAARTGAHETPDVRTTDEPPGFHLPVDETGTVLHEGSLPLEGDQTMAGTTPPSGPPSSRGPASDRPVLPESASPERLFAQLESGVDRSLAPPRPAADVTNPPPSGEFRRGLRTADEAYAAYNEALDVSVGREVAIYHDPRTGEYRVVIGSETGVRRPGAGWQTVLHYHPNPENVLTFRLPAPQDFNGLMMRAVAEDVPVREFIEFDIPGVGRGRTEYGIDIHAAEPFYVKINYPDGTSRTIRFAHDGAYRTYWGSRTIVVKPGSPLYEAMIRDIQEWVRSLEDDAIPGADPGDRSMAGSRSGRSTAQPESGLQPGSLTELQTGAGELTQTGVDLIREEFRTITRNKRRISLDTLTDAEVAREFFNQWRWLEAVVLAEARARWTGRETPTDFVMADSQQTLNQVVGRIGQAFVDGQTGHAPPRTSPLRMPVYDYLQMRLHQGDRLLGRLIRIDGRGNVELLALRSLAPELRRKLQFEWDEFLFSQQGGTMKGFLLGEVGNKKPDVVEVMLSSDALHVIDATFRRNNPIHEFKTAFYRAVLEQVTGVSTVTAGDYRSGRRQTPVGP